MREDLWEEVTFDLKQLARRTSIPERRNSKFKGPEVGTAGMFKEQKGSVAGGECLKGKWRKMKWETGELHQVEPVGGERRLDFILIAMESHCGSNTYVLYSPIATH